MIIDQDFSGGNIRVLSIQGDTVFLENELRDTQDDWFYWAFRVRGAQGRTLTFDFGDKAWVGPFGAAMSHDALDWTWTNTMSGGGTRFAYAFSSDEEDVYFCHDLRYSPERFERFAAQAGLETLPFAQSPKGREIRCVRMGSGAQTVLLTSRHHACESTGTFVMEGMLRELSQRPIEGLSVIAVPFIDMDGAQDGDQGKNRAPHDHNRDYIENPIYDSVRKVKALAEETAIRYAFDLHAPWHCGGRNDDVFIVRKNLEKQPLQDEFSILLERATADNPRAMRYDHRSDLAVNTEWNLDGVMKTSCGAFFSYHPDTLLAISLETTYFGRESDPAEQEKFIELGKCLARALSAFHAAHCAD